MAHRLPCPLPPVLTVAYEQQLPTHAGVKSNRNFEERARKQQFVIDTDSIHVLDVSLG